ncbi:TonB-dependent receptor [Phenylobacterium sp.]|uniref:TonB-dependent receptor n=1 Tax=Phenylobacterium sp. TaxID=1871053 RepID=UPI0035B3A100
MAEAGGDANTLTEIVVTARKREEKLFDVPNAITAVAPSQMDDLHLNDARDVLTLVPTAFLQENNAGTARDISIRGVGTPTLFAEPGVALYVDEIYSSGFISYPTQFYDLERVEVLRGPQGALYGRNAVGGAVNVISKAPTDTFEASLKATVARYDRYELQGVLNAPVNDRFGLRLAAWRTNQDKGEYYNQTLGRYIDASNSSGVRLSARATPTDQLTLNLTVEHNEADTAGTNLYFPGAGETKRTIERDTQPVNSFDTTRLSMQAAYDSDTAGRFTLVAGGRDYSLTGQEDTDLSADFAPSALNSYLGQQVTDRENKVRSRFAEARWLSPQYGPFNLLAGITYLNDSATGDLVSNFNYYTLATGAPADLTIDNRQRVKSWAGFAEATWTITPAVSLIADLRYTNDKKTADFTFLPAGALAAALGPQQTAKLDKTFDNWSPGVTLAWTPADDLRVYGKIQSGFRAGGFNYNVANAANLPYGEETSVNYEAGAKKRLWDGRASVAATAYLLRQKDVLVPLYDLTAPGPLSGYLANAGKARTWGLELEGQARITTGLDASMALGWLDAELTSGTGASGLVLKGKELPSSRPLTASLTLKYRHPITGGMELMLDGAYTYRARGYQDLSNTARVSDANLLNLSAGLDFGRFQTSVYVNNALDDDYDIAFGGVRGAAYGVSRAQGETYGLSVAAKF